MTTAQLEKRRARFSRPVSAAPAAAEPAEDPWTTEVIERLLRDVRRAERQLARPRAGRAGGRAAATS